MLTGTTATPSSASTSGSDRILNVDVDVVVVVVVVVDEPSARMTFHRFRRTSRPLSSIDKALKGN